MVELWQNFKRLPGAIAMVLKPFSCNVNYSLHSLHAALAIATGNGCFSGVVCMYFALYNDKDVLWCEKAWQQSFCS